MLPRPECRPPKAAFQAALDILQTPAAVLSGVFAERSYGRGMDILAVALILALFAACAAFLAGIERL
jgi:hypothetical protein